MLFKKVEFAVMMQHIPEAILNMSSLLRSEGFDIFDLRESDIVKDSDNSVVDRCYIILCTGGKLKYNKFKRKYGYKEVMYEGRKLLR